ncbi:MAG: aminopeptidase [Burkholderiaceae bacterium]|nr:aminopeptidase [Burkholderiaceae bacterium]
MAVRLQRWALGVALLFAAAIASGCGAVGYYAQAVHGHFALLAAARPIDDWLQDPTTPEDLKDRLRRAQAIRAFASRELALPENASYTTYADLKRPAAVWNVFAAPELSLQLKTWCYPVLGCAGYRGYFARAAAEREAAALRAQGYDVAVAPVPAYSTLGWFDDPLLNTFIRSGEGELARLIFHELAHQVAYAKDDTVFNESFATLVEQVGVQRWLADADASVRAAYAQQQARRADFIALLLRHRRALAALYEDASLDAAAKRERKTEIFAALRTEYARIKAERWGGFAGYDAYFAQELNNAHLAAVGAYHDLVPAFEALLRASGGDLPRFYARVRELARAPRAQRHAALQEALARR